MSRSGPHAQTRRRGEVAAALQAWLDAQQRIREAVDLIEEARRLIGEEAALVAQRQQVEHWLRDGDAAPGPAQWDLEDVVSELDEKAAERSAHAEDKLMAAIDTAPELPEGRRMLSELLRRLHSEAERRCRPIDARRLALRLARYDDGTHTRYLQGWGALSIHCNRPAHVELMRLEVRQHRRFPCSLGLLGSAPIRSHELSSGSYLVRFHLEGGHVVNHPIHVPRDGTCEVGSVDAPLWLPSRDATEQGFAFVPGGRCKVGGDPLALGTPLADRAVDVAPFFAATLPVTVREYLCFIEWLVVARGEDAARFRLPRANTADLNGPDAPFAIRDRRVVYRADADGDIWDPDWPVVLITHDDCHQYCQWRAEQTGLPIRLLTDVEWEKLGRGCDGAVFPWGTSRVDGTFACIRDSFPDGHVRPLKVTTTDYREDTSVFGPRLLAGGVMERVSAPELEADRVSIARGGHYGGSQALARCASRMTFRVGTRSGAIGFRLAYSPPAAD